MTEIYARRVVLVAIALDVPILRALAPYDRTFASTVLKLAGELLRHDTAIDGEAIIIPIVFLGLLTPLHPASSRRCCWPPRAGSPPDGDESGSPKAVSCCF